MDNANLVGDSTILEPSSSSIEVGNGAPVLIDDKAGKTNDGFKPQSIEDVLDAEAKRLRDDDAKEAESVKAKGKEAAKDAEAKLTEKEKAEKDAKASEDKAARARSQDGKFAAREAAQAEGEPKEGEAEADKGPHRERTAEEVQRETERRKYAVVAQRFTPEARAKWDNVPHPVKAEIFRLEQEREAESQRTRPMLERYEQIRQYDELSRTNGRDLKQSLEKVVSIEQALARNPIAGLNMILREIGPKKPDGTPISLYEVAQHIVQQGPQAYQQTMARDAQMQQQRPQVPQANPEIAALRQEIQSMRAEQTVVPVVNRFAETHPDFEQLAPQIKMVLDKGIVDDMYGKGLTHEQKLHEAYRIAGGNVSSGYNDEATVTAHSQDATARPVNPDAGRKSVRGAPSDGEDPALDDQETDVLAILRKEWRKMQA